MGSLSLLQGIFPTQGSNPGLPHCKQTLYQLSHKRSQSIIVAAAAAKSLQSCLTLCDPTDGSPPGSSIPGILQARILERVAISFSNACMHAKSFQPCPTLCDPMDSSPPGSSVHGILQARIPEGVSISMYIPSISSFFSCIIMVCWRSLFWGFKKLRNVCYLSVEADRLCDH